MKYVAIIGIVAAYVGQVQGILEWVVLAGAAAGATVVLFRQVIRPMIHFGVRASQGVDILLEMPDWRARIEKRLDKLELAVSRD